MIALYRSILAEHDPPLFEASREVSCGVTILEGHAEEDPWPREDIATSLSPLQNVCSRKHYNSWPRAQTTPTVAVYLLNPNTR